MSKFTHGTLKVGQIGQLIYTILYDRQEGKTDQKECDRQLRTLSLNLMDIDPESVGHVMRETIEKLR